MKRVVIFLCLVMIALILKAQNNPTGFPTQSNLGWQKWGWQQSDSGTIIANRLPNFTPRFPGTTILHQDNGVDTTLKFWTGSRWLQLALQNNIVANTNMANANLTVTANRLHKGGKFNWQFDSVGALLFSSLNSWAFDAAGSFAGLRPTRLTTVAFPSTGSSTFGTTYIMRNVANSADSITVSIGSTNPTDFRIQSSSSTGKYASITGGVNGDKGRMYIRASDSLFLFAIPKASADSIAGYGPYDPTTGTNIVYKIPAPTFDTAAIPSFSAKVRSLFSGTSPITYNEATGTFGVLDATTTQKGVASFNAANFSVSSSVVSLADIVSSGSCMNCDLSINDKGQITSFSNGSGGGGSTNTNIGSGYRWAVPGTNNIKSVFSDITGHWDTTSNTNALTYKVDTSVMVTTNALNDSAIVFDYNYNSSSFPFGDTVVFFGHSYVAGTGATTPAQRYTSLICSRLGAVEKNLGVGGSTVMRQPPENYQGALSFNQRRDDIPDYSYKIKLLSFDGGLNDAGQTATAYTLDNYVAAWDSLIDFSINTKKYPPKKIVILGVEFIPQNGLDFYGSITGNAAPTYYRMQQFDSCNRAIAIRWGIRYIPMYDKMLENDTTLIETVNYVHPTDSGYAYMANQWLQKMGYGVGTTRTSGGDFIANGTSPQTADYNITGKGIYTAASGTNRSLYLQANSPTDNFGGITLYPNSGTNVGGFMFVSPKGTGFSDILKSEMGVFNTDYVADPTNYETTLLLARGVRFSLNSFANGSGTPRPLSIYTKADSFQLYLDTNGAVGFGTMNPNIYNFPNTNYRTVTIAGPSFVGTGSAGILNLEGNGSDIEETQTGFLDFTTNANSSNKRLAIISAFAQGATSGDRGGYLNFYTKADGGSTSERARITNTGNLLINTTTDDGEKLQVNGSVAFDLGSDAMGDIYYRNSSGSVTRLGIGSANQQLRVNSEATAPEWFTPSSTTTLYTGDGTLAGNRSVNANNLNLTFDDLNTLKINYDFFGQAKANGNNPYTSAIGTTAANYWQFAYTPTLGTFSRGVGVVVDTLNNVGLGSNPLVTMPLYNTGNSAFINGLQSFLGNFYRVGTITTDGTLTPVGNFYVIDASGGNITITLPAASTCIGAAMGWDAIFKRIDNSLANTVTIQVNAVPGTDTIDGSSSFTLTTQYESKRIRTISTSAFALY